MTTIAEELRHLVYVRAKGRCEYCLIHNRFRGNRYEVDHIRAQKHGGKTIAENLCLSCVKCNRYKGSDLSSVDPLTDQYEYLFNPRLDNWDEHFKIEEGRIEPLTPRARATTFLLHFNDKMFIEERLELIEEGVYPNFEE